MQKYVEADSKNMEVAIIKPGNQFTIVPDDKVEKIIKSVLRKKMKKINHIIY